VWGKFFTGLQQDGLDGMLMSLRSLMDETGAAEGLPLMIGNKLSGPRSPGSRPPRESNRGDDPAVGAVLGSASPSWRVLQVSDAWEAAVRSSFTSIQTEAERRARPDTANP